MKKRIIFSVTLGLMLWLLASPAISLLAQDQNPGSDNFVFLADLPGVEAPEGGDFGPYVNGIVKLLIGSAGVLAVIVIIIGGLQYMTTDAISGKEEGKEKIWRAVLGLIMAMASWLILFTINPELISTSLNVQQANLPSPGGATYLVEALVAGGGPNGTDLWVCSPSYPTLEQCQNNVVAWIEQVEAQHGSVSSAGCVTSCHD
jgi:hypothetical protein